MGRLPEGAALLEAIKAERQKRAAEAERARVAAHAAQIRARCISLAGFIREAWHILEPDQPLVWNWHLDAICQHLEAVTDGKITRLLINIPPGTSKSLIVSVLWPAWEWGPRGKRSMRYVTTSFSENNVKRDTRKTRDLIASDWYQTLWPEVRLTRSAEMSFANDNTGFREGVPFGSLTGQRGNRLIIDDPHSTETAESDADRKKTTRKFRTGAVNRLNDQTRDAIVVIMQRLHHEDISGVILKMGGYVHLCLPMEFEADRRCKTSIGFEDPRTKDGELLDAARFPPDAVADLRKTLGSLPYAGQYQQRPVPREGGMFKRAWFEGKIVDAIPAGGVAVRHWDLAATKGGAGARTAGVKIVRTGFGPSARFYVAHVITEREEGRVVRSLLKATAETDGKTVVISLPQDPGQAGKTQKEDMIAMLAGWRAYAMPESGDKATRAEPFAAQCEAGNVYLLRGPWNELYIDELCSFPGGGLADQVDASSGAFARLAEIKGGFVISDALLARTSLPG